MKIQKALVDLSSYKPNEADQFIFNSQNVLNGDKLFGIKEIKSNPAVRESQSHVIGYGGDVYYTKTHPSGSFDEIPETFDRNSVQIGMLILFLGYMGTSYYVKDQAYKSKFE